MILIESENKPCMHSNTLDTTLPPFKDHQERDALSLYRALEQITDHRKKRGVRYPLALVLSLIVLGKLAGMTTLTGIAEWVRWRAEWLHQAMPLTRASVPCASTYANVLRGVDAQELTETLAQWLTRLSATRRCGAEPSRLVAQEAERAQHVHLALDGKTLRGTLGHAAPDQPSQHVVALYETQTGVVLAQQAVPDKGNEISLETTLLTPSRVQGRIITADAMHTQRACCATITRFGGTTSCLPKTINRPWRKTCVSSLRSRLPIAATGGRPRPGTKDMGGWNVARWWRVPS